MKLLFIKHICLYLFTCLFSYIANNPYEAKYQLLINKRENVVLKHCNDLKAFTEYSYNMDNIYDNINEYNPNKKRKMVIVFDDMIADVLSNIKL